MMGKPLPKLLRAFDQVIERSYGSIDGGFKFTVDRIREKLNSWDEEVISPLIVFNLFVEGDTSGLQLGVLTLNEWLDHDGAVYEDDTSRLIVGDLIDDVLECTAFHVCVLGNAKIEGIVRVGEMSPMGSLTVGGDLTASSIDSDGFIFVGGRVTSRFTRLDHNDGYLDISGELSGELLVATNDHYFACQENRVQQSFDCEMEDVGESIRAVLFEDSIGEDGNVIEKVLHARAASGDALLRT